MPLEDGMLVFNGERNTMHAYAPCVQCRQFFNFNPHLVPSVVGVWHGMSFEPVKVGTVPPPEAVREPVCLDCVERANAARKPGEPHINILPGAYDPAPGL